MRFFTLLSGAFEDTVNIKKNMFTLLLLYISLQILFFWLSPEKSEETFSAFNTVVSLTGLIVLQFFHVLFLYFFRHKKSSLRTGVKAVSPLFIKLLVAITLIAFAAGIGFVLLIIPGLLVMSFLFLVEPIVLFEGKNIFEAMKESYERVKKGFAPIFLCIIFYVIIAFSFTGNQEMSPFWLLINGVGAGFVGLFYAALMQRAYEANTIKSVVQEVK
jgi:hypothetical protein